MAVQTQSHGDPPTHAAAVAPSDTTDLPAVTDSIFVSGAGDLRVTMAGNQIVTFPALAANTTLRIRARRIHVTGTTATGIIALWTPL